MTNMYLPDMDAPRDAPERRAIITLTHAIVNDETTLLPGLSTLSRSSMSTSSLEALPTTSSVRSRISSPTSTALPSSSESRQLSPLPSVTESSSTVSSLSSLSSLSTLPTITTSSLSELPTSSAEISSSPSSSSSSPEPASSTLSEISSTISEEAPSSTELLPLPESSSLAIARPGQTGSPMQDKETVEGDSPVAVTVPPPNNRGTAVGIAFGAFAGFAVAILAGVLFYRLKKKNKPRSGIKQFQ